jgi:hypothetical protein
MAGHEIEGLKLRLGPLLTIRGSVVMETSAGVPAPKPPQVDLAAHVSRNALALGPRMGLHSRSNADGSFTLENVSPGVYRIIADDPPRPYYLDTIRLGEAEPATGEVELYSGAAQITLVYKADGGTVRGTVENCASGGIRLVPQDTAMRRPGFLRSAQCDSSDRYEIDAVRPGDYYALAFAGDSWPWESAEPDHDGLLSQAGRVAVRVGETAWADLHAITRPAY